jgi:hypothetical protein
VAARTGEHAHLQAVVVALRERLRATARPQYEPPFEIDELARDRGAAAHNCEIDVATIDPLTRFSAMTIAAPKLISVA